MARYIRNHKGIVPIKITEESTAISLYADDTTIITFRSKDTINKIFEALEDYAIISGLKVNKAKTQIMCTGSNLDNNIALRDICTITDNVNILGISLSCHKDKMISNNYHPVLENIRHSLNIWSQRNLSLFGKIEIAKTLAISHLVYIMSLLPSPSKDYLYEIEKSCFFISFGAINQLKFVKVY